MCRHYPFLAGNLFQVQYTKIGKCAHKDEFVTLSAVDPHISLRFSLA